MEPDLDKPWIIKTVRGAGYIFAADRAVARSCACREQAQVRNGVRRC